MNISAEAIHLWLTADECITEPPLLARYEELLSSEERERWRRFHFEKHRHRFLVTRALLRSVLSLYEPGVVANEWTFTSTPHAKPEISGPVEARRLRFNISHADGLITLALTLGRELGVDVENTQRGGDLSALAGRFFAAAEVRDLMLLPPQRRKERFFDLWTLKEAYIKACGLGLSIPLDHFSYSFPEPRGICISFAPQRRDDPKSWRFWQLLPTPEHKIAIAIRDERSGANYEVVSYRCVPLLGHEPSACEISKSTAAARLAEHERVGGSTCSYA